MKQDLLCSEKKNPVIMGNPFNALQSGAPSLSQILGERQHAPPVPQDQMYVMMPNNQEEQQPSQESQHHLPLQVFRSPGGDPTGNFVDMSMMNSQAGGMPLTSELAASLGNNGHSPFPRNDR